LSAISFQYMFRLERGQSMKLLLILTVLFCLIQSVASKQEPVEESLELGEIEEAEIGHPEIEEEQQLDGEEVSHRNPGFFWKFMQKFGNEGLFTVLDHTKKSKKIKKWIKRFEKKKGMKKLWDMNQEKLRSKIDKAIKNFRGKKASKSSKEVVSHRAVGFFWKFLQKFGNKELFTVLGHEKKSKKMKEWIKKFEKKKGMKKLWDMDTEELRSKIDNLIKHFRGKNASKSSKDQLLDEEEVSFRR